MNSRLRVDIFVEDRAHEYFIRALVMRVAREEARSIEIQIKSATGGHGRAIGEFKAYQAFLDKGVLAVSGLIVVGIDANCERFTARRKEILDAVSPMRRSSVVVACPDPHVERWYMADAESFHRIVGSSRPVKRKKCGQDYYKMALSSAVREAGHPPTLNGVEFAEELAEAMDFSVAGKVDRSFATFIDDLRSAIRRL
jgi:hypothetical protein